MKSLGIIAEFHPFHSGHKYLIEEAKKRTGAEVCVSVISGDFMQRGIPAVLDKWSRAEEAVKNGVNLVIELPTVFACNSAEYFAKGGVALLEGLGMIDFLAFGSECGDLEKLMRAAEFLRKNHDRVHREIQSLLKEGCSYPKARAIAVSALCREDGAAGLLSQPNNILGVEYLKQTKNMIPLTIKRKGHGYHATATAIRAEMERENPERFQLIRENYWRLVSAKILQTDSKGLEEIFSAGGGLGNKLKQEVRYAENTEDLIGRIKSKVYTHSRISRLLTQTLLDIDQPAVYDAQLYGRVLALDQTGSRFLREIKKNECAEFPLITNINKGLKDFPQIRKTLEKDILAADMYNLIAGNDLYRYSDYVKKPYVEIV